MTKKTLPPITVDADKLFPTFKQFNELAPEGVKFHKTNKALKITLGIIVAVAVALTIFGFVLIAVEGDGSMKQSPVGSGMLLTGVFSVLAAFPVVLLMNVLHWYYQQELAVSRNVVFNVWADNRYGLTFTDEQMNTLFAENNVWLDDDNGLLLRTKDDGAYIIKVDGQEYPLKNSVLTSVA